MIYCLTILIAMIVIAVVDVIVDPSLGFGFCALAVTLSTVAVIALDGILATIIRRVLPESWFTYDKKFFQVRKQEQRLYEKFGIKKWKDKVIELGMFTNFRKNKVREPENNKYLERFILESNYGFIIHLVCAVFGFLIVFLYPLDMALYFGIPVALVNAVLNFLPAFILRYNVPKLLTLHKFNARKQEQEKIKVLNTKDKINDLDDIDEVTVS